MKVAGELMSYLVKDKHFSLYSVCELHKPCATAPRCSLELAKRFVNFDDVKTAYCKEHQMISCASVDGLSIKNEKLLFVEIKGWADFLHYQKKNVEKKRLYRYCPWMRGMATSQISCYNGIDKKASHVPL